jgi:hypothetical protein
MSGLRSIVLKNPLGRQGRTTVATTMRGPVELARHMWRRAVSERGCRQSWPHLGRFIHKGAVPGLEYEGRSVRKHCKSACPQYHEKTARQEPYGCGDQGNGPPCMFQMCDPQRMLVRWAMFERLP